MEGPEVLLYHILCRIQQAQGEEEACFDTRMAEVEGLGPQLVWALVRKALCCSGKKSPYGQEQEVSCRITCSWSSTAFVASDSEPSGCCKRSSFISQFELSAERARHWDTESLCVWMPRHPVSGWPGLYSHQEASPREPRAGFCRASIIGVKVGHHCRSVAVLPVTSPAGRGVFLPTCCSVLLPREPLSLSPSPALGACCWLCCCSLPWAL